VQEKSPACPVKRGIDRVRFGEALSKRKGMMDGRGVQSRLKAARGCSGGEGPHPAKWNAKKMVEKEA